MQNDTIPAERDLIAQRHAVIHARNEATQAQLRYEAECAKLEAMLRSNKGA